MQLKPNSEDIVNDNSYEKYRKLEEEYLNTENLLRKLLDERESQNKYVSRELYHVIAQTIYSLLLGIRLTINSDVDKMLNVFLKKLELSADEVLRKVKKLSFDLYPQVIDEMGFMAALTSFLQILIEDGRNIKLLINGIKKQYNSEKELLLYRVTQEILNFIINELKVNTINILLTFNETIENKLLFTFNLKSTNLFHKGMIEEGLVITMKMLKRWNGHIRIFTNHPEKLQWSIEANIP